MAGDETETVLAQYQMFVEMADRVSARRASANTFFVTINTALVAVFGLVTSARKIPSGSAASPDVFGLLLTAMAGVVLSVVWLLLLSYYRRLNGAKFAVINQIECRLPIQPFTEEWRILNPEERQAALEPKSSWWKFHLRIVSWKRRTRHREATRVEQVIPFVFMIIYGALGLRAVFP